VARAGRAPFSGPWTREPVDAVCMSNHRSAESLETRAQPCWAGSQFVGELAGAQLKHRHGTPRVSEGLKDADEIELTIAGRSSGRPISRRVVRPGRRTLYLLPVTGSDSRWYENVLKTPAITLAVDGVKWNGKTTPIRIPPGVCRRGGDVITRSSMSPSPFRSHDLDGVSSQLHTRPTAFPLNSDHGGDFPNAVLRVDVSRRRT